MNVSQIRNQALALINQLSTDGTLITPAENADFFLTFLPNLNTAQNKFSDRDKIERNLSVVQDGTEPLTTPYNIYPLPDDYISMNRATFQPASGYIRTFTDYLITGGSIYVGYRYEGMINFYYFKKPTPLVLDSDVPEIQSQCHQYLSYFAAGEWLMATGKQADGIVRLNQFDGFLREVVPSIVGSSTKIENTNGW